MQVALKTEMRCGRTWRQSWTKKTSSAARMADRLAPSNTWSLMTSAGTAGTNADRLIRWNKPACTQSLSTRCKQSSKLALTGQGIMTSCAFLVAWLNHKGGRKSTNAVEKVHDEPRDADANIQAARLKEVGRRPDCLESSSISGLKPRNASRIYTYTRMQFSDLGLPLRERRAPEAGEHDRQRQQRPVLAQQKVKPKQWQAVLYRLPLPSPHICIQDMGQPLSFELITVLQEAQATFRTVFLVNLTAATCLRVAVCRC